MTPATNATSNAALANMAFAEERDSTATQFNGVCALLALLVRNQAASQAGSRSDIESNSQEMQALKEKLADAIEQAKEAASHSGFFSFLGNIFGSDIAKIAGAVAAAAAIVATGGAAAPLVLLAASAALEAGAQYGPKLGIDPKICAAIGIAGAAIGICSGAGTASSASTFAAVARDVKVAADVTSGTATATGAVLNVVASHYQSQQLDHQADATGFQAQSDVAEMAFDAALAALEDSLHTEQSEKNTASQIVQNDSTTNTSLIGRI